MVKNFARPTFNNIFVSIMSLENRIDELEMRIAHQDNTIEELNQTAFEQWQVIDQLTKDLQGLKARLKTITQSGIDDAPYVPPHY